MGARGRGFLEFPRQLEIELLRNTEVGVNDVRLAPDGTMSVSLKEVMGHILVRSESNRAVQPVVATDYATATPLADNTQFFVCHAPGVLTCIVAVNGKAQVEAQNQVVVLDAGEGTFVLPNEPPRAPYCANLNQVRDWLSLARTAQETSDLGSMVVGWLQKPSCEASANAAVPAPPLTAAATNAATPPATSPTVAAVGATTPATSPTVTAVVRLPSSDGMVQIPTGRYVVGASIPDDNHMAVSQIDLAGFWIDKFEVTNAQYKTFLDQTGHAAPAGWTAGSFPAGRDRHPAAGLTWDDAVAYCTWADKRLPTETEWEVAGRGPGSQPPLYPWGPDPTGGGKVDSLPQGGTYEVGTMIFNQSPFGVFDMTGSLWQWTGTPYAPVPQGYAILRGGRHGLLEDMAYRQPAKPNDDRFTRVASVRCAADRVQDQK